MDGSTDIRHHRDSIRLSLYQGFDLSGQQFVFLFFLHDCKITNNYQFSMVNS